MKTQVAANLEVDGPAIAAVGTFTEAWTIRDLAAFERAAIFDGVLYFVVTAMIHPKAGFA